MYVEAEKLGIITFKPDGRPATKTELKELHKPGRTNIRHITEEDSSTKSKCTTSKLRKAGVPIQAEKAIDSKEDRPDRSLYFFPVI